MASIQQHDTQPTLSDPAHAITTTSHFPHPSTTVLSWLQDPTSLLQLNPLNIKYTQTSAVPLTYTISFRIPVLFGSFSLPVSTSVGFELLDDGILSHTDSNGVKTSSRWTVAEAPQGCVMVEEFRLLKAMWGIGGLVLGTARKEHEELFRRVGSRLEELYGTAGATTTTTAATTQKAVEV